tara:strand:- start:106 stop:783 length:678 start_codon:yes stop_codon:yes gene_type:complete
MGLFGFGGGNKTQTAQQFGAPSLAAQQGYGQMGGYGMQQPQQMGGLGAMGMMQQAQNPMMQQAANDPVLATSQLLALHDPVSMFVISQNMALVLDLIGEIMMLSVKEFFANVSFKIENDVLTLDAGSLPSDLATLSAENLALTLQKAQGAAQNTLNANQQQLQMFLAAHQQGMMMNQMQNPASQPGFFGSLLGGMMGNAVQQNGGFGATVGQGMNMAAKGAAVGL